MGFARGCCVLLTVIAGLVAASEAHAATPRVSDEGHFFSADAVAKANQKIKDIQRLYGKDLLIETVPGVPANMERRFKEVGKKDFFVEWARRRAEDAGINGVYILISKNPGHLQIEVSRQLLNRGFSSDDQETLVKKMSATLNQKKNDAALLGAVGFVDSKFAAKLGKGNTSAASTHAAAPQKPIAPMANREVPGGALHQGISPLGWLGIILAVVAGIWLISAIFRMMAGGGAGSPMGSGGPGGYGGGGGGGFFSSLLGGLFGATAGMWLYNNVFSGGSHWGDSSQAYGGESTSSDAGGFSDAEADFDANANDDAGGGDFSDAGSDFDGGGDFGGGDFGGGDFGGGDFGGGDFGGGDS